MPGVLLVCVVLGCAIYWRIRRYLPLEWTIGSSIRYGRAYRATLRGPVRREA